MRINRAGGEVGVNERGHGSLVGTHAEEASRKRAAIAAAYERDAYRNNTSSVSTAFKCLISSSRRS